MKKMLLTGVALGLGLAFSSAANAQIKIGVAGPITGPNAAFGAQLKNGVEQAVEDINAAGGINGQKLQIVVGDDVSDPKQGVSVANKFAAEGVKFVVGHFNSGVSIPASQVYEEAGIVQVTPASTNPQFTERGMWNTFRTCGRDDQQGLVAGSYLADKFKGKKVAVVHDKTPYGKGLADETQKAMNAKGLKEVVYEGVNPGEKDYSALVSKLKQAGVDVVYFGGLHTEAGLIIRQMRDQGLQAPMMSGDGIVSAEFTSIAGPGAEGTLMTFSPDPRKNPNAKDVGGQVQGQELRAGSLHPLLLRRGPDPGRGCEAGWRHRRQEGRRRHEGRASPSRPSSATSPSTRRATSPVRTTSCTSGRRAPTARSTTPATNSPCNRSA